MDIGDLFSRAEKQKPKQKTLIEILEEQALKNNSKSFEPGNNLRASGFGGCLRANVYKSRGYESTYDLGTQLTFEQGHKIHEVIQDLLQKSGILKSMEEEIETLPGVPGHYDGLIHYVRDRLLEIKTVGFGQFERLFKFGQRQISKKYKIQAHLYMKSLGVQEVVFLFVNKNRQCSDEFTQEFPEANQQLLEIILDFDQDFYDKEILARKRAYDEHIENNTLPPRTKQSECDYCPFLAKCSKDHEDEKAVKREAKKEETKASKNKVRDDSKESRSRKKT